MENMRMQDLNRMVLKNQNEFVSPDIDVFYLMYRWKGLNMKSFLDLGCGTGRHTLIFAKNDFQTNAFDINREAVAKTKDEAETNNLKNISYSVGDMVELPYKDNSIDCVLCFNVIENVDSIGMQRVVSELERVLNIGGECYLTIDSKNSPRYLEFFENKMDENTIIENFPESVGNRRLHYYVDYGDIKVLFKAFNLEIVYEKKEYVFFDNLSQSEKYVYHILISKK